MPGELRVKHRTAPIIVARMRRRARHLPACQRGAGFGLCAIAQHKSGDTAFSRRQGQPPAGHQVQAFGHAFHFQQQRPHMGTGQNVMGGRQGIGGIARAYQDQSLWIAAQFQQPVGRYRAIFHGLIIRPHPEQRLAPCCLQRQQDSKAAGAPARGEDFVHTAGPQPSAQHRICLWMTSGHRHPVGRQAVLRQRVAQFRQFCAFVHDMFYTAARPGGSQLQPAFVSHSQIAQALIKLTHARHVAPQLVACSHAG